MGLLGDAHCCDPRCLPYVKRDVMNIRAKLRQGLSLRDLELTVEYFKRRKAENPNFFVKQVDADQAIRYFSGSMQGQGIIPQVQRLCLIRHNFLHESLQPIVHTDCWDKQSHT